MTKLNNNVLKRIAVTGTAIAAVLTLDTANIAYAMAVDEVPVEENNIVVAEVAAESSAESVEPVAEPVVEEVPQTVNGEELVQELESEVQVEEPVESEGQQETQQESQTEYTTSAEATEALEIAQAEYESVVVAYDEAGYNNDSLDSQEAIVNEKLTAESEARQAALDNKKQLSGNNYYNEQGRGLAIEMIKYKLLLDGEVDGEGVNNILYQYYSPNYEDNHFCVKYVKNVDGENVYCEKYFDYVTCDENGQSIFKGQGVNENNPANVTGINILEKTPVYSTKDKLQKVGGQTYMSKQRVDFEVNENGLKKGTDWYTLAQYKNDINTRKELAENTKTIAQKINVLTARIAELLDLELLAAQAAQVESKADNTEVIIDDNPQSEQPENAAWVESQEEVKETIVILDEQVPTAILPTEEVTKVSNSQTPAASTVVVPVVEIPEAMLEAISIPAIEIPSTVRNITEYTAPRGQTGRQIRTIELQDFGPLHVEEEAVAAASPVNEAGVAVSTIEDDGVAKNLEVSQASMAWNGYTLPVIGLIAFFLGFKKSKEEE